MAHNSANMIESNILLVLRFAWQALLIGKSSKFPKNLRKDCLIARNLGHRILKIGCEMSK